jgi:hypothetical protein
MTARRLGYLASLAGCFVFYICYQKWLGWILFVCLLGLPVLSLALSLPAMLSFRLRVDGPVWVAQGEEAKLQMLGGSRFPIPPFRGKLRVTKTLTGETATHTGSIRLATVHCGAVEAGMELADAPDGAPGLPGALRPLAERVAAHLRRYSGAMAR